MHAGAEKIEAVDREEGELHTLSRRMRKLRNAPAGTGALCHPMVSLGGLCGPAGGTASRSRRSVAATSD